MDRTELFCKKVEELDRRSHSLDEYDVVHCSAILRQLLLDQNALVDQVSRYVGKFKERYRICSPREWDKGRQDIEADTWFKVFSIDPVEVEAQDPSLVRKARDVRRQTLLAIPLMSTDGHEVTVKDLIRFAANVEGGVHAGKPFDGLQAALDRNKNTTGRLGLDAVKYHLRAIAQIVARALLPLKEELEQLEADGQNPA